MVGGWYLENYPSERDRRALLNHLHGRIGGTAPAPEFDRPDAAPVWSRQAVRSAVSGDYATGNTLWLDGWLFSRTELRLCALAALT